ncbi:DNA bridging protein [Streptomyces phage BillNye]|uniref:DNA bridging protein n=2 Tax=Wilnyevirus billnye TaxID=2560486 RepID=A0A2L1IWA4_9CAUD|nr:DNA bridging protein [Streptomyces phage BillNye]AVD99393.1 DNA bridging protein [Streptomyces phage BillNye]QBZ72475.1 Lsr2-like DNA bridging protein [Streptomyces phage Circinus]
MARTTTRKSVSIDVRSLSGEVREFCRENGIAIGSRGRVSAELFVEYLMTQPKKTRELAKALSVPVNDRGRVAFETTAAVGVALATNKAIREA